MIKSRLALIILVGLTLAACSSARVRVMSTADGVQKVVADDIERDGAEKQAFKAVNKQCQNEGKQPLVISEKTEYRGTMDESQRALIRKASNAAFWMSKSGSDMETAGKIGQRMTSDRDYRTEIQFKCQ